MKTLIMVLMGVAIIGAGVFLSMCPCGPVPGAWLFGSSATQPVSDWSFVNDRDAVPLCQVEISTWRPHSINLNCMAAEGDLYVSCSRCAQKQWSNAAVNNPEGRIRAGSTVYPVTLSRITNSDELDVAWEARRRKTQGDAETPRPDHWWSFRLVSR